MNITDFTQNTLENIKNSMDFNGYSWFDEVNYKATNNAPCFIPENAEDLTDVFSWQRLFKEALETIKTKEFLLAVAENYDNEIILQELEHTNEEDIDYEHYYVDITDETPEQFAENFMDNYFLGGNEVWCSLSTKLEDYMM